LLVQTIPRYLYAVGTYWVVIVTTASPFVLDEFLKRIWPRFREWFEKTVSPKNRRRWEIAIMVCGFIAANFLAFEDEHTKRVAAETLVLSLTKEKELRSPNGEADQVAAMQAEMKKDKAELENLKAHMVWAAC
jgi:hypothetical protein